jgi:hypothetical protein
VSTLALADPDPPKFNATKQYPGVVMEQGRVTTVSDGSTTPSKLISPATHPASLSANPVSVSGSSVPVRPGVSAGGSANGGATPGKQPISAGGQNGNVGSLAASGTAKVPALQSSAAAGVPAGGGRVIEKSLNGGAHLAGPPHSTAAPAQGLVPKGSFKPQVNPPAKPK